MEEPYPQQELPQPGLPEQQAPATPAGPPDFSTKRKKFLTKFSELAPEVGIDEVQLGDILADDTKRDEFTTYVGQLNPKFAMTGQQLAEALGYDIKKKSGGVPSGTGSPSTPSADEERLNVNPEVMGRELGIRPQDTPDQSFLPQTVSDPALAAVIDPVQVAGGDARQYAPEFTGPLPAGTYTKPSDKGTAVEGTQYSGNEVEAPGEAADVADDGFWATLGKQVSNLPATVENAAGNTADFFGDMAEMMGRAGTIGTPYGTGIETRPGGMSSAEEIAAPLLDNKPSDIAGQKLRDDAATRTAAVSQRAQESVIKNPTNAAAWGNLLGQGANSVVAVGAASLAGGPVVGVAAGGALGISSTKDAARAAGISDKEAAITAAVLAPVQGILEETGLGFIMRNAAARRVLQTEIVKRAIAYGEGKILKAGVVKAASEVLPEMVKRYAGRAVVGGLGEAGTEFAQGEAEGAAQLIADAQRDPSLPGYGVSVQDALVNNPLEQAVGGLAAGGSLGGSAEIFQGQGTTPTPTQPIAGTKPVPVTMTARDLRGRTVLVNGAEGKVKLGSVQEVLDKPTGREYILSDAEGKLSRHAQGDVFINDGSATPSERAGNRLTQAVANTLPAPSGLQALQQATLLETPTLPAPAPRVPATDPGPTADPAQRPTSQQAPATEPAQPIASTPNAGPTLSELVPDEQPVSLTYDGAQVQAFRNAEGDIELHQPNGQVAVLDKGDQFNQPAAAVKLSQPKVRVKAGDNVTLGSGEFATEQPIEDVLRDKSGQITAVMVASENGPRIIEADTPEGKAALAELNEREQQPVNERKIAPITPTSTLEPSAPSQATKPANAPAYSTPAENRKTGRFTKDGQTYTRQEPLTSRAVMGSETSVSFASNEQQPARYALIEADELQPSHTGGSQNLTHFLPEAQPKNRSAAFDQASREAIQGIAAKPDAKQLGEAPTAYAGAPVVNSRGEVIQGNGRAEGVRQHYRQSGTSYRSDILSAARRVGIDPAKARQMKQPVLVRVADVSDARAQQLGNYTAADTESGGQRRLDPKQAVTRLSHEARAELAQLLSPQDEASLSETIRAKQDSVFRFLQKHKLANSTQLQTLFKAGSGEITANGLEDIASLHRGLLFAGGDPNLPELFQELPAAAQGGLDRAAAAVVGLPKRVNITTEIQNAVVGVNEYRRANMSFDLWVKQQNIFGGEGDTTPAGRYSPLELALIKLLTNEKRPTFIARAFGQYAAAVRGEEASLFDAVPALTRGEAVTKAFNTTDENPRQPAPAPTNGRPETPPAPGMASSTAQPQRAAKPAAANPQPATAAGQQLTGELPEAQRAKIQSTIEEAAARIQARRAARRQAGNVYSSVLGVGEIDPEDLKDALIIAKGHIKLGALKVKELVAKIREAGLDEEAAPTEALRPHLKKLLAKNTPAKKALKDRRHATRQDEATRRAFTEDEARYAPVKQIENAETASAYLRQVGLENAYAVALDKPEGFSGAAHVEVQEQVAREYRRLSDEARKAGNQDQADEFWQRSKDVRAAKVSALTQAGQTLAQVKGFIADDPDAVLDLAIKETEKQRKPLVEKAEREGARVAATARRARRAVMEAALKSETVRRVRERVTNPDTEQATKPTPEPRGYGAQNKFFTKASAQAAREAMRKLGLSIVVPPELVHFVGYHIEAVIRAGGNHSFAEVSRRVVRELGAKVKPMLPEAYEQARKSYVRNGGDNVGFDTAEQIAKAVAPAAVQAGIKKLDMTLNRIAREQADGLNMKGRTLAERFIAEAGLSPEQANTYAAAVEAEFAKQVVAKKTQLGSKLVNFSTRVVLGKNAATAVDKLLTTLNLAIDPASAGELLKKQLSLPDITPADADRFVKLAEAVRKAKPGNERSNRVQDLMQALGKLEHVNKFDLAQSVWFASILSGPLTHGANLTSNAKEAIAENLISLLHTWADTGSLKAATASTQGAYKAQKRAFAEAAKIISTGYTGTQSEKFGHQNILEDTRFKGLAAPLNGLKYVGRALASEDSYFNFTLRGMRSHELAMKLAYREVLKDASLAGEKLRGGALYQRAYQHALGQLYGLDNLHTAAEGQADAEALTGTARTKRIGELMNKAIQQQQDKWTAIAESEGLTGVAKQQRVGELQEQAQPASLVADAKQFAAIHTFNGDYEGTVGAMGALIAQLGEIPVGKVKPFKLLAPFAKILTSVTNRRLEWAGMGFVRALKGGTGSKDLQGGKFYREYNAEEREKAFLRSTIGTVSALALYSLAKAGIITITGSSFADKDKEEENPSSSIKWGNGLFTSYEGDTLEIILAAIGNTLEHERKLEKAGKLESPAKRLAVIAALTSMYTLSMTPAKGVEEFTGNVMGMAKNPDKGMNYAARFGVQTAKGLVPYSAAITQTLKGLNILRDANAKETNSEQAWRSSYNSLVADLPWVRDGLEDAISIYGEPMKVSSDRLWGWAVERSAADQASLDFLADHELLPARSRITDASLAIFDPKTGKVRPLSESEFKTFQIARGQAFARLMREAMKRPSDNPSLSPRQRDLIRQGDPEGDKGLADLPIKDAKKIVSNYHRQAVAAGKQAVFGTLLPTPTK